MQQSVSAVAGRVTTAALRLDPIIPNLVMSMFLVVNGRDYDLAKRLAYILLTYNPYSGYCM
jgi:hypothetical protein